MAQTKHQQRASDTVAAWLAHNDLNITWLAEAAEADPGTVGDFLAQTRWPKLNTQGRIEKALGWPAGSIRQMGQGATLDLPMELPTVGGPTQDVGSTDDYVSAPGAQVESRITNEDLLREILRSRAESDQIRADVRDLSERVERIERRS